MIISIGSKVWAAGRVTADSLIKSVKELNKGKLMIVAVEKGNNIDMRKDIFETEEQLLKQVQKLTLKGFKVHYTKPVVKEDGDGRDETTAATNEHQLE